MTEPTVPVMPLRLRFPEADISAGGQVRAQSSAQFEVGGCGVSRLNRYRVKPLPVVTTVPSVVVSLVDVVETWPDRLAWEGRPADCPLAPNAPRTQATSSPPSTKEIRM
ncbi:hypothetical protein BCF44_107286 [Kutzneria buriramensis]|uniref:Uncharacterized protein n=1 Tax=Kutzneria buriramensis TaxID=1045776 RepID=A0A3E0HI94_9PSEU|nr:hypothetical protein [Kutzneria buriramensis]REH46153.1 hypothetical protein BCF44_107286 [Kutzneria buriramensis]